MKADLAAAMATPDGKSAIETALARFDPGSEQGRASLHAILERQNYRLAWWRAAADEINWRRFFDITSLAGLRVELPEVFDATHVLILRLYAEGLVDGLRVDHVDGLADPRAYCRKLRRSLIALESERPPEAPPGPAYLVVEKILAGSERMPGDFATDGTTGYDFMDQVGALLHDPEGEAKLTQIWTELGHGRADFETEQRAARRLILRDALASELNTAAAAFHRIARRDLRTRDFTLTAIRRALTEVLVHFPVYRLYTGRVGRSDTDERVLERALSGARRTMRPADRRLLDLIAAWLGGDSPRALPPGPERRERLRAMTRFQQLSSPVAAKSVEDTSFYRYGRLLSRNDVGSDPGQFALPVSAFHAACRQRQRHYPHALLATATHDHKRGEDVRARLAVLSEIPEEWESHLRRWTRLNRPLRREIDGGAAPDPADELMLYQTLVGAWMPALAPDDANGVEALAGRVAQWQEKALREAKRHTEWAAPEPEYESACRDFLYQLLDPARPARLNADIAAFAARIAPAGAVNGLAQTVLRLTTPGVPDLYQGTELWDGSLVDPDNRRPVDYTERDALLNANPGPAALLGSWQTGQIKQSIIARILAFRAAAPALFAEGQYTPLRVEGPASDHVLAFLRQHGSEAALIAVTRLPAKLLSDSTLPLVPPHAWHGTRIALPHHLAGRTMSAILGCANPAAHRARIAVEDLFANLPVAVLRFE
jgi:(1->4)-alpha-D-glucan 1-alpha-D-glucosylmutase